MGLTLTETAAAAVKRLLEKEQKPAWGLRMGVTGGGCAGMNYSMAIEETPKEGDVVSECHGVRVFVDPKSYLYLNGVEVDYVESMMGSGFKFSNPNASKSCGCGTSFAV
ncbi:MAG: iron-sulfur cluster assembly accessory protein [Candidatus Sumerlaeia bacterium]|nr:iron-sulfur cluster assembly accessory protein [Candidatus Sumerlaeia bacterium]